MSRDRLAFIDIAGPPRAIGAALGAFGRDAIHGHLLKSRTWQELQEHRADPRIGRMADLVRNRFPRYWAELQGLAEGLQLPLDDTVLWNCRGDVWAMAPDGCTTVQAPGPPHVIAHNEDGDPGFAGHCAVAHISSEGGNTFSSFVYPGSLPGHTFAATSTGIVQTVNNLRPLLGGTGVPRMVLTRAILDAASLDEAVSILRSGPRAGAFHLTLAQAGDRRMLGIEFTAAEVSVQEIKAPALHANHMIHADTGRTSQIVTGSSAVRQRRGEQLLGSTPSVDADKAIAILWDRGDSRLPIYRTDPHDPDVENTLATALFRIDTDKVEWCVYDGPSQAPRFDMRDGLVPQAT